MTGVLAHTSKRGPGDDEGALAGVDLAQSFVRGDCFHRAVQVMSIELEISAMMGNVNGQSTHGKVGERIMDAGISVRYDVRRSSGGSVRVKWIVDVHRFLGSCT